MRSEFLAPPSTAEEKAQLELGMALEAELRGDEKSAERHRKNALRIMKKPEFQAEKKETLRFVLGNKP